MDASAPVDFSGSFDGCGGPRGGPLSFTLLAPLAVDTPGQLVASDLDGDGHADIAFISSAKADAVTLLRGDGNGFFQKPDLFAIPPRAGPPGTEKVFSPLIAADLNSDGHTDLITASYPGVVSVLLSDGRGSFRPRIENGPIPPDDFGDAGPWWLTAGDLGSDGKLDLLVGGEASDSMTGDGKGGLRPRPLMPAPPAVMYFDRIWYRTALGDLDEDNVLDAVAIGPNVGQEILHGLGNGYFTQISHAPGGYQAVAIADLNRDGHLDLVAARPSGVEVLPGKGDGTFGPLIHACPRWLPNGGTDGPNFIYVYSSLPVVDIDRDGALDIVVMSDQGVVIARGVGDGTFQHADTFPIAGNMPGAASVALADMNGDCRPDVVIANSVENTLQILLNTTP